MNDVPADARGQQAVGTSALFLRLPLTARLLIACRAARSVGQGALVADFAFYLAALHWTTVQMGAVYMGGLLLGAGMTLVSGPLSDRVGRKPFLLAYGIAQVLAAIAAMLTSAPAWLVPAAVLGTFGRGANGAAGPFGPVEQAWLSQGINPSEFGQVYSLNAAVGFGGMAAGSLLAMLPHWWAPWLPGPLRYRPLFLLVLLGSVASLVLLIWMQDARHPEPAHPQRPTPAPGPNDLRQDDPSPGQHAPANRAQQHGRASAAQPDQQPAPASPDQRHAQASPDPRRQERGMLARLVGINALNGLAIGIIGPFMAFWFHLRFGLGPAAIGPVLAAGFVMSIFSSLLTGWLTHRLGTARAVVMMRLAGLVLFVALPFAPSYGLAAACYVLRAACNRGTAGARQAVGLKLVGSRRRGLAASLNAISMQVPRALGPVVGGWLLEADLLALPFLVAAALQAGYLALYGIAFRNVD